MKNLCEEYFVEYEDGDYYVYNEYDELVHVASSKEALNDFQAGLGDMQESMEQRRKKEKEQPQHWEHDKHLEEVCKYYREIAGLDEDAVLTEEMLDKDDWKLRSVSVMKNTPVRKIRQALLRPKDSE